MLCHSLACRAARSSDLRRGSNSISKSLNRAVLASVSARLRSASASLSRRPDRSAACSKRPRRSSARRLSAASTRPCPTTTWLWPSPAVSKATSFRRTRRPLIRYWFSPERNARRVTETSANSIGSQPSELSKASVASAIPAGARPCPPLKMTSSVFLVRSACCPCSPRTQRTASATFDLPLPFGPTIPVIPGSNAKTVLLRKLLKPWISRRVKRGARKRVSSSVIAAEPLGTTRVLALDVPVRNRTDGTIARRDRTTSSAQPMRRRLASDRYPNHDPWRTARQPAGAPATAIATWAFHRRALSHAHRRRPRRGCSCRTVRSGDHAADTRRIRRRLHTGARDALPKRRGARACGPSLATASSPALAICAAGARGPHLVRARNRRSGRAGGESHRLARSPADRNADTGGLPAFRRRGRGPRGRVRRGRATPGRRERLLVRVGHGARCPRLLGEHEGTRPSRRTG